MIWTIALAATGTFAAAAVAFFTWRNSRPTDSIAQLLHATEEAAAPSDGR
ncbi:MAG TPA: hypothetical protein VEL79_14240 [Vicinamibacterales bacterium]|nr:hypothetical protein [Vicinamibacterales bacterium]